MDKGKRKATLGYEDVQQEFMLSDVELGILERETYSRKQDGPLKLIVFNRLEMILELNRKLFAN